MARRTTLWQIQVSRTFDSHATTVDPNGTVLPTELLDEAVPGNIRRAEHFTAFLARFVEYLKVRTTFQVDLTENDVSRAFWQTRMRVLHVVAETPLSFLQHLKDITFIERKPLKYDRVKIIVRSRY